MDWLTDPWQFEFMRRALLAAALAAVATTLGVSALTQHVRRRPNTAIGIMFAGLFALGLLLISSERNSALDLNAFLVGNILGVVLALAMLVAPAATAQLLSRSLPRMMALGTLAGLLAVVVGLYASFHLHVAAGPAIVLAAVALFILAFLLSPRGLTARRRPAPARAPPA